jgi:hypothetical protein
MADRGTQPSVGKEGQSSKRSQHLEVFWCMRCDKSEGAQADTAHCVGREGE